MKNIFDKLTAQIDKALALLESNATDKEKRQIEIIKSSDKKKKD